jgi:hypothetical protein
MAVKRLRATLNCELCILASHNRAQLEHFFFKKMHGGKKNIFAITGISSGNQYVTTTEPRLQPIEVE